MLEWVPVDGSSSVAAIAYDDDTQRIFVTFSSGSQYWYDECSMETWQEFVAAPSKGQFVNRELRHRPFGRLS